MFILVSRELLNVEAECPAGAIPQNRGIQKNGNSVFFMENISTLRPDKFWQKVSHSIGDYKTVKTCRQCLSLMEKLNFILFFISLFSGIALLAN